MQLFTASSAFIDLEDMSVDRFKETYLTGFTFYGADGQELPDRFFTEHLNNALAKLGDLTSVAVVPQIIMDERHDYYAEDYRNFAYLPLYRRPIRNVREIRMVFPDNMTVMVFPSTWATVRQASGQLQIVPTAGTLSQMLVGNGVDYVFLSGRDRLPDLWRVDYEAGFDPKRVPRLVADTLFKMACVDMMAILSDMVYPVGVTSQSVSMNGVSQNRSYMKQAFSARIQQYKADLGLPGEGGQWSANGQIIQVKNAYSGISGVSV